MRHFSLTFAFQVGILYIFNLIVGTGALALPKAFQTAGYVLSVVLLTISATVRWEFFSKRPIGLSEVKKKINCECFSYISATFVCESLAVANAVTNRNKRSEQIEYDGLFSVVLKAVLGYCTITVPPNRKKIEFLKTAPFGFTSL